MNPLKAKLLTDLIEHLSSSQGGDLKSMLDESKKPNPLTESEEDPLKPKGIEIEKVSVLGKPKPEIEDMVKEKSPGMFPDPVEEKEAEMTDEEMKELIEKYLR